MKARLFALGVLGLCLVVLYLPAAARPEGAHIVELYGNEAIYPQPRPVDTTKLNPAPTYFNPPRDGHTDLETLPRASTSVSGTLAHSPNVELVDQIGGISPYAVAAQGDYVYAGFGPRLLVIDVSNPLTPTLTGQSDVLPGPVQNVAVAGNLAYTTVFSQGLYIINVTEPVSPNLLGFAYIPDYLNGVAVEANHAYVVNGDGMYTFNVSNPASPNEVSFLDTGYASDVTVTGTLAYIAGNGLHAIDVTNPISPTEVGDVPTPGDSNGVAVEGDFAYIADGNDGLAVIQITEPATSTLVGQASLPGYSMGVAVAGDYAYVADALGTYENNWTGGLRIVDISNPADPHQVGFVEIPGDAMAVAIHGEFAYTTPYYLGRGLDIIQLSNPTTPTLVSEYDLPGDIGAVETVENYAYLHSPVGLEVVDVTDPTALEMISTFGFWDDNQDSLALAVEAGHAYLPGWNRLNIIDVTNPISPVLANAALTPSSDSQDVVVVDDYAYIPNGYVDVINVSNPQNAQAVGSWGYLGAEGVAVMEPYAFIAGWQGFYIHHMTTPTTTTEIGFVSMPGRASAIAIRDKLAYVGGDSGLHIIDIADPAEPIEIGSLDTLNYAFSISLEGHLAYVADGLSLRIINVYDPTHPFEIGFYDAPCYALDTDIGEKEGLVFVAGGNCGLMVFRVVDVAPDELTINGASAGMINANIPITASVGPISTTFPITYTWQASGQEPITHTGGLSDTAVFSWHIAGPKLITVTASNISVTVTATHAITLYTPVEADFTAAPTTGRVPLSVQFANNATGDFTQNLWHFGDGITSTLPSPSHTYGAAGSYTVTLAINGPGGDDTQTKAEYITVENHQAFLPIIIRQE